MSELRVSYQIKSRAEDVDALARKIAIEQSVETPESLITGSIEDKFVGKSLISHLRDDTYLLELTYQDEVLSQQFNQLLNLAFGNVAMYPNVRLTDIQISKSYLQYFQGPRFGVDGIRSMLDVYDRPLLATALKPRGCSDQQFANLAYEFALGGGDIVKDDQNLVGNFDEFKSRVSHCHQAVRRAADKTGKLCLYFPFISAPFEELEKYFDFIHDQDIKGVLLAPSVLGLDTARGWAAKYNLIYMAHPTFTGSYCVPPSHGMDYRLFYGLLFRLAGVDISVYPNTGGRFQFSKEDCKAIASELTKPVEGIARAFPCPAGGMQYEHLNRMCHWYGKDAVFLLGGSLLEYSGSISHSTQAFLNRIIESLECDHTDEMIVHETSCENSTDINQDQQVCLQFNDFNWEGRESIQYKHTDELTFEGIRRVELIGKQGERTAFDLRYFEIESGGFSSLEKHHHTHVVIIARGQGEIKIGNKQYIAYKNDIFYIKPMTIHQLLNNQSDPFGFYCIVDRQRDKPVTL
ncbi:MAG: RuBisCO large subunit C-terminal-like domain-containing protein [Pseudomonadota bacterium]